MKSSYTENLDRKDQDTFQMLYATARDISAYQDQTRLHTLHNEVSSNREELIFIKQVFDTA
jgi:hypothetical protein